jgi:hypothetical protein
MSPILQMKNSIQSSGRTFMHLVAYGAYWLLPLRMPVAICFSHFMFNWTSHSLFYFHVFYFSFILFPSFVQGKLYRRARYHTSSHSPSSWIWHHEIVSGLVVKLFNTRKKDTWSGWRWWEVWVRNPTMTIPSSRQKLMAHLEMSKKRKIWESADGFICSTKCWRLSMKTDAVIEPICLPWVCLTVDSHRANKT